MKRCAPVFSGMEKTPETVLFPPGVCATLMLDLAGGSISVRLGRAPAAGREGCTAFIGGRTYSWSEGRAKGEGRRESRNEVAERPQAARQPTGRLPDTVGLR